MPDVLDGSSVDYRTLFDASPTPLLVVRPPDWVIVAANDARLKITGTTREEQIGRRLFDVFPDDPDDPEADGVRNLSASLQRVVATHKADAMPVQCYSVRGADGVFVERWWSPVNTPVLDREGRVALIIHHVEDVTEVVRLRGDAQGRIEHARGQQLLIDRLRGTSTALRESEARRATALSIARLGTFEWEPSTGEVVFDERSREIFGFAADQALTATEVFGRVHPHDLPDIETAAMSAAAERGHLEMDCRLLLPDGATRIVASLSGPVVGAEGMTQRVAGVFADVTARKADEIRLRELNEHLEQEVSRRTAERNRVWEMSRELLAIVDFDGQFQAINPAWTATLGRDAQSILSQPAGNGLHPDDQAAAKALGEALLRGETVERFEARHRHSDETWRWISWTLVPEGDVVYAVGRDITVEKEAAAELEHAQEALRQSQKMEAMGSLTGGVAHDFNNLLTPILGALDLLQRKGLGGDREQRLIAGAIQSADRARTLVQRLLAFARRQPLQPTAVDIRSLVQGMADLLASTTGPQVRVVVEAADDLPPAKADPNQLEMALLNLGVNARDAMADGGTLRITVTRESVRAPTAALKRGHYVRLSVADTGVGMDEATLAQAVEPFFSTKGVGKGTGLGLSMAHGLAAQLGGALTIQSRPGLGTHVELWLPISPILPGEDNVPTASGILGDVRGAALLVDDEDVVRESTADMLEEFGYKVLQANSGEAALALVAHGFAPDLLITDHLMSGMTGIDLARALRGTMPDLPVLIVSGYAEVEGMAPDLPRLTKPFRSAELESCLAAVIGR